jgi:hypothetical protein
MDTLPSCSPNSGYCSSSASGNNAQLVGDYQEKSLCIAQLSQFAEQMGVRRKYREAIEQALDEMLMNALYDAPVDEHGKPIFSEIPTKTRISLRVEQKVVVQYACDGSRFAIGVRDVRYARVARPCCAIPRACTTSNRSIASPAARGWACT